MIGNAGARLKASKDSSLSGDEKQNSFFDKLTWAYNLKRTF